MTVDTKNGFRVYGHVQSTRQQGQLTTHGSRIDDKLDDITSGLQAEGVNPSDVMILTNRSWRTALNALGGSRFTSSRIQPDIIVVRRLSNGKFELSAYEAYSPGNGDRDAYADWLDDTFDLIAKGNTNLVKGAFQLI